MSAELKRLKGHAKVKPLKASKCEAFAIVLYKVV